MKCCCGWGSKVCYAVNPDLLPWVSDCFNTLHAFWYLKSSPSSRHSIWKGKGKRDGLITSSAMFSKALMASVLYRSIFLLIRFPCLPFPLLLKLHAIKCFLLSPFLISRALSETTGFSFSSSAMKDSQGTSDLRSPLKSLLSKVGGTPQNKYKKFDAKLEKKVIEVEKSWVMKHSFKSINSIIIKIHDLRKDSKNIRSIFEKYDEDRNGVIELVELMKGLKKLNLNLKPEEVEEIFRSCDIDGRAGIQFKEFIVLTFLIYLLAEPSRGSTSKMGSPVIEATFDFMLEAFLFLDKDGDGKLNKKDMIKSLKEDSSGENLLHTSSSLDSEMDWDKSGRVSVREFIFGLINWVDIESDEEIPIS